MRLKSVCALAALTLAAVTTAVRADTFGIEADYGRGSTDIEANIGAGTLHVTDGFFWNIHPNYVLGYAEGYSFDLDLALDADQPISFEETTNDWGDPITIKHAAYTGTYTTRFTDKDTGLTQEVSSGIVTMLGASQGEFFGRIDFTNGLFTQTGGAGLPDFPGVSAFTFNGTLVNNEALSFSGELSTASAVPLPASATMGLGLIGLLGAAQFARRRFRTA
jgi:hypothetical protein